MTHDYSAKNNHHASLSCAELQDILTFEQTYLKKRKRKLKHFITHRLKIAHRFPFDM